MPTLQNPRHERFAQELAKGKSQGDAYKAAGYDAEGHAAESAGNRLLKNVEVQARVAELQERSAVRAEISVASVTENLTRIAKSAEELTGQQKPAGLAVARAAWMDAAKLNGLVVDRKEVRTGALDDVNPDELDRLRAELIAERDRRAAGGDRTEGQGKPH